jgi:predicted AlkP superfamily pyrophosphatase or phosphodiesterase
MKSMATWSGTRRVVLVVLDGLRADAFDTLLFPHVARLRALGASTLEGQTVAPSVTAAAMTSLLTGVPPTVHGLTSDHFHLPRTRGVLHPLPRVLEQAGYPSTAFIREIPRLYRGVAERIGRKLGACDARFAGRNAPEILMAARGTLATQRRGLILLHWPDADMAGHDDGWMSPAYQDAARRLDATLGLLAALIEIERDPHTLLVVLADHGGGGVDPKDHDSAHPLDRTIPVLFVGGHVPPATPLGEVSLLDIPPTILAALGVSRPASYVGRVLEALFTPTVAVA